MTIIGVEIHKPSFRSLTGAVLAGVLLWAAVVFSGLASTTKIGAGANLSAILFGCICNACGIDVTKGLKHLLLNVCGCVLVLFAYQFCANFFVALH